MKKVVFTFGRLNPPTVGHQKLVDKVVSAAKKEKADAKVFLSHTQNNKKDPLNYAEKIRFARKAFGKVIEQSKSKTIIQILQELEKSGFTDVVLVVGSDRVTEFSGLLN
jgi:nicotinic acid mononucleotide adenylyltransferase